MNFFCSLNLSLHTFALHFFQAGSESTKFVPCKLHLMRQNVTVCVCPPHPKHSGEQLGTPTTPRAGLLSGRRGSPGSHPAPRNPRHVGSSFWSGSRTLASKVTPVGPPLSGPAPPTPPARHHSQPASPAPAASGSPPAHGPHSPAPDARGAAEGPRGSGGAGTAAAAREREPPQGSPQHRAHPARLRDADSCPAANSPPGEAAGPPLGWNSRSGQPGSAAGHPPPSLGRDGRGRGGAEPPRDGRSAGAAGRVRRSGAGGATPARGVTRSAAPADRLLPEL